MIAAFGDCTEPWANVDDYGELCHDDKIYLLEQRSTYSLVSLTEKGVQTGESFVEFLRFLRIQIDARNVALLAANQKPIEFPVVYLGDNHGSRFHEEVLKITDPDDPAFIGILLDFEESNTSQFLQMWDQINRAAHAAYNKGKDEYKKQYKPKYAPPPRPCTCPRARPRSSVPPHRAHLGGTLPTSAQRCLPFLVPTLPSQFW